LWDPIRGVERNCTEAPAIILTLAGTLLVLL
jgi:hypothetical protein